MYIIVILSWQDSGDQFHTHNGKSLIAVSAGFQTCTGFPEEKLANVLFEETFFVDEARYINVSLYL